jgi:predicted amidohydrolase YtcJ
LPLGTVAPLAQPAHATHVGGDILMMKGPKPAWVQALAVRGGRIAAVGARDALMRHRAPATEVVDAEGGTLLPGFIDGHGHVPDCVSTWGLPDLQPPPVGRSGEQPRRPAARVRRPPREEPARAGRGADRLGLRRQPDRRAAAPTRADLDAVSRDVPLIARHASPAIPRTPRAA